MEIKKEDETVYSQEVTLEPGVSQDYLQISTTEYATMPIEDLPAPPANNSYIRFFFPGDVNEATQLELTTYYLADDRKTVEKVATIVLNAGEISKYSLYDFVSLMSDGQRKYGIACDLKNLETGEMLTEKVYAAIPGRGAVKLGTAQIKNNGSQITLPISER